MDSVNIKEGRFVDSIEGIINKAIGLAPKIALGVGVFLLFMALAVVTKKLIIRFTNESGVGRALARLSQAGVLLGGFLVACTIAFPSVKPADILGVLGVGGVAIGFAFRDILQNYLAGILLLWREPFEVGDQIRTSGGFEGTVQAIETRATLIRTYDGRRVVIPNSDLFTDSVTVNTARDSRRSQYDVGIGYADDIEEARRTMLETCRGVDGVAAEPAPDCLVVDLADSTVNLRLRWWTDPDRGSVIQIQDRVLTAVKNALDAAAIDMPYPTNVLLFHDQTEATDGDREAQREGWPAGDDAPRSRQARRMERFAAKEEASRESGRGSITH